MNDIDNPDYEAQQEADEQNESLLASCNDNIVGELLKIQYHLRADNEDLALNLVNQLIDQLTE